MDFLFDLRPILVFMFSIYLAVPSKVPCLAQGVAWVTIVLGPVGWVKLRLELRLAENREEDATDWHGEQRNRNYSRQAP